MVYWSPTHGFQTIALHGEEAIPAEAVQITPARHYQLLDAQAEGATIVAGNNGAPVARRPKSTLTTARAAAVRAVKREARRRILAIAPYWRQLNDARAIATAAYQLGGTLTTNVDVAAALERGRAIDAVRADSATLVQLVAAMSADELAGFDPGDDLNWSDAG